MNTLIRPAVVVFVLLTLVTGVAYPLIVTLAGQGLFPRQANGSLILDSDGKPAGSDLIGQPFDAAWYFWGRPSATERFAYNSKSSSGSNLGPTNPDLLKEIEERVAVVRAAHPDQKGPVPADLVTKSASGLDPHISPEAAEYQVARVAAARDTTPEKIRELVTAHTESRTLGIIGEPRVNVLKLNRELDLKLPLKLNEW
jgi:K+-transporting ATPase ATPase C chain